MMRLSLSIAALASGLVFAQPQCQFYLADQTSANQGFALHLDAPADSKGACQLNSVSLTLTVGDGSGYHKVTASPAWQTGVVYTAKAVVTAAGPQQLSLNGQSLGSVSALFKPAQTILAGAENADSGVGAESYVLTDISLQITNGANSVSIAPTGNDPLPLPLVLMSDGGTLWRAPFTVDSTQPVTITATFRFDPAVANPHQFDPYVDAYGQAVNGNWPSKVKSDADLQAAIDEEQTWFASNGPLGGMDAYGGSTIAGWTDKATGYFHTAQHAGRWWLITPLGNPSFYIWLDALEDSSYTPITGREPMFALLPAQAGDFAAAYAKDVWNDAQPTTYISFADSNRIRKYGSNWRDAKNAVLLQRLASWGFAGAGKWTPAGSGVSLNPVLMHASVPNAVPGGHPDIFDSKIAAQLKTALASAIGSNVTNPGIVGWSVGNEKDEIITASEMQSILALGATVPAKMKLVDHALSSIYSGSVTALASAWKITASTVADIYASKPSPPPADVETLRQFYEQNYYATLYQTVKAIDPNHLYVGNWILPRAYPVDWPIVAANCDVIGSDFYSFSFNDPAVQQLIQSTAKPVLIGEFSFPSTYGGLRGFGSQKYPGPLTDSASGDLYTQWLHDASANPNVVGVEWFEYRDEPISGRGNNNGDSNIGPALVLGESYAFGMIDVADRPKYDLVNKVRAANIAALQSLGLLGSAPVLTSPPQNGATYVTGGLVPGSFAQVKGTNLADVTRIWQDADFVGLGNKLPNDLSGVQVLVNGTPASVYYISSTQISFQVPSGIAGTANVQVVRDGLLSNTISAPAVSSAPGIFPIVLNGTNYAAGVFLDGKIAGDPSVSSAFRKAKPGDVIQLFATGLAPSPAGIEPSLTPITGVTITIGGFAIPADFAALVAVGEFQINFKVPQLADGSFPITISINGVSSPATINSDPPGPVVLPIQH